VFVRERGGAIDVLAEGDSIATLQRNALSGCEAVQDVLCACASWRLRPRALALTMWARLFLADLFIHGIGGAKYDRITDVLIEDYFGVAPPAMACVSATLHLGLPNQGVTNSRLGAMRRELRDFRWNPQRRLPADSGNEPLVRRRIELAGESERLKREDSHNHRERRRVFQAIREMNEEILNRCGDVFDSRRSALVQASGYLDADRIALSREYFFGLYSRDRLEELLRALPPTHEFRV
jgi:hypothetical protein